MIVIIFSVAVILCQLTGNGLARPEEENLRFFDQTQLSDGFRRYEVTGCAPDVNACLREMHQGAERCIGQWKRQAGARYEHCIKNDPVVVNATRDWQVPSQKWHKSMDQCLAGNEAPSQEALQSLAIESAAAAYYSRKKRNVPSADDVQACWRAARQTSAQCKQKAAQCTQFAHCYGEGPEPSNDAAKRWFKYVKRYRTETKNKSKIYIMHMGHCLRNEPHTNHDHGGQHHGMHGGNEHAAMSMK